MLAIQDQSGNITEIPLSSMLTTPNGLGVYQGCMRKMDGNIYVITTHTSKRNPNLSQKIGGIWYMAYYRLDEVGIPNNEKVHVVYVQQHLRARR